jgi:hypothetical protein
MTKQIDEQMEKNKRRYRNRVEQIREDQDLHEDARHKYLKEAHQEARTKHTELFEEQRAGITERLEKKRKAALAPPTIFNADRASLSASYRDALDRVASIDTTDKLKEQLERAELTGDAVLAKAVLFRGYELEDEAVVGAYLQAYPDDRKSWDEFVDAGQQHSDFKHQERMFGQLGPEPPRELGGVG